MLIQQRQTFKDSWPNMWDITVVGSAISGDSSCGHKYFPNFYVHEDEVNWLSGEFPLSLDQIKGYVVERCELPASFNIDDYVFFQGTATRVLEDNDVIDIGGRSIQVVHTPGHSPGHMCFYEKNRCYLFTGDLIYKGTLFAYYPSTDPQAYLKSIEKVAVLPVKRVFPAHHDLEILPTILKEMKAAFNQIKTDGKLHHGSGIFEYGNFAILL